MFIYVYICVFIVDVRFFCGEYEYYVVCKHDVSVVLEFFREVSVYFYAFGHLCLFVVYVYSRSRGGFSVFMFRQS